jgi:molybdopterin synthase catalytic subunit
VDGAELSDNPEDEGSNLVYVALALAAARQGDEMRGGFYTQAEAARSWVLNLSEWAAHPLSGKEAWRRDHRAGGLRVGRQASHILVFDRHRKMVVEEAISPVLTLAMKNM